MAFVDEITLHLKAGNGGSGIVAWLHEKGKEFMGPGGGDGGRGGDVYLRAVRDIGRLSSYRYGNTFGAPHGRKGEGKGRHGKSAEDLVLEVPIGSCITNRVSGRTYELLTEGEKVLVLRGGAGGFGNKHFKSSRNVRPQEYTEGKKGAQADFDVELRLIADAGLIGLPNAGKSSLLNALTAAHAKVGSYAFTTLEPNLGALHGFILADIPGLIEGASAGKGLGFTFLRHIVRTRVLLHCISSMEKDPLAAYAAVREELKRYDAALPKRKEAVVLTKADEATDEELKKLRSLFRRKKKPVLVVSIIDDALLKKFKEELLTILQKT